MSHYISQTVQDRDIHRVLNCSDGDAIIQICLNTIRLLTDIVCYFISITGMILYLFSLGSYMYICTVRVIC